MNKATIYFHSGTGNSYRVAQWMAETAQAHGLEGEVLSIHRKAVAPEPAGDRAEQVEQAAPKEPDVPASDGDWVALVAPAHAFTASWAMLKFALRMERGQGRQAAVALTRAGTKFGKRRFPGLEGTGCYVLAGILAAKGYRVRGTLGVDMPSNWTQLHPGFAEPAAADIIEHAKAKTKEFTAQVVTGRRCLAGGWAWCWAFCSCRSPWPTWPADGSCWARSSSPAPAAPAADSAPAPAPTDRSE